MYGSCRTFLQFALLNTCCLAGESMSRCIAHSNNGAYHKHFAITCMMCVLSCVTHTLWRRWAAARNDPQSRGIASSSSSVSPGAASFYYCHRQQVAQSAVADPAVVRTGRADEAGPWRILALGAGTLHAAALLVRVAGRFHGGGRRHRGRHSGRSCVHMMRSRPSATQAMAAAWQSLLKDA